MCSIFQVDGFIGIVQLVVPFSAWDPGQHIYLDFFDVDFSYCGLNLEVSWYSLEQYIGCIIRQAFNYYCSLLQV